MSIFRHNGQIPEISHKELVKKATLYLRNAKPHTTVISERTTAASETPDVIGFRCSVTTLVECKASRPDFLADAKKHFRVNPEQGMGYYRYYMAAEGLLLADEMPDKWGLLEVSQQPNRLIVRETKKPEPFFIHNQDAEITMLVSTLRRLEIAATVFVRQEDI